MAISTLEQDIDPNQANSCGMGLHSSVQIILQVKRNAGIENRASCIVLLNYFSLPLDQRELPIENFPRVPVQKSKKKRRKEQEKKKIKSKRERNNILWDTHDTYNY